MSATKNIVLGLAVAALFIPATPALARAAASSTYPGNVSIGGYQFRGPAKGPITNFQAKLTVPTVTCSATSGTEDATLGIISTTGIVIESSVLGVCSGGVASYQATALGSTLAMTISPGDQVILRTVAMPAPTSAQHPGQTATVEDLTTGVDKSVRVLEGVVGTTGFIGVAQDDSTSQSIPAFGTIDWTNATFNRSPSNSSTLGSADPHGYELVAHSNHSKVLVSTSAVSPSGGGFKNAWVAGG